MFCPSCRTEYREGFFQCTDCQVALVHELPPPVVDPPEAERLVPPAGAELMVVYETEDVYVFLAASNILRQAKIPFAGTEQFTGEFRPRKRAQAPYLRTLLVETLRAADAIKALEQLAGEV